ncbi:hypothetical protein ABZ858_21960 [Streptomyces sp. NPDC047017]|uniref:hypothetical protein n=1 Tax=Streptomyces sp. NPDC047017 TaxID=3155024 RepID=UPI0033DC70D8
MGEPEGGRRGGGRAHPDGAAASTGRGGVSPRLLLATALRASPAAAADAAERRALEAFRTARADGTHRTARTRHRDDWRPRGPRRARRVLKTAGTLLVAGLALGSTAMAATDSAGPPSRSGGHGRGQVLPGGGRPGGDGIMADRGAGGR